MARIFQTLSARSAFVTTRDTAPARDRNKRDDNNKPEAEEKEAETFSAKKIVHELGNASAIIEFLANNSNISNREALQILREACNEFPSSTSLRETASVYESRAHKQKNKRAHRKRRRYAERAERNLKPSFGWT